MINPKSKYYQIPNKLSATGGSAFGGKIPNPKLIFGIWKLGFIW